jgi:uncharacterized protein Veg
VEPFEGAKVEGILTEAGDSQFTIKTKGSKKEPSQELTFAYEDVKTARVLIRF